MPTIEENERISAVEKRISLALRIDDDDRQEVVLSKQTEKKHHHQILPPPTDQWIQRPLLLRPTPSSSTKILGIRRSSGDTHFGTSGSDLPINNGRESDPLVVDFASHLFIGTLLLRIKDAPTLDGERMKQDEHNSQRDYFLNKKRKFQCIVKGRFKTELKISNIYTGQQFDRPAGSLPPKWIIKSFIKLISYLAPQLDASLDGDRPRFISPLFATAQTVLVEAETFEKGSGYSFKIYPNDLKEKPSLDKNSVLSDLSLKDIPDTSSWTTSNRMAVRKKIFNTLAANNKTSSLPGPVTSMDKTYTFEFYQHMLDFSGDSLNIDIPKIGATSLVSALDGQPIKILAAYKPDEGVENCELKSIYSFDLWHESLFPDALKYDDTRES